MFCSLKFPMLHWPSCLCWGCSPSPTTPTKITRIILGVASMFLSSASFWGLEYSSKWVHKIWPILPLSMPLWLFPFVLCCPLHRLLPLLLCLQRLSKKGLSNHRMSLSLKNSKLKLKRIKSMKCLIKPMFVWKWQKWEKWITFLKMLFH